MTNEVDTELKKRAKEYADDTVRFIDDDDEGTYLLEMYPDDLRADVREAFRAGVLSERELAARAVSAGEWHQAESKKLRAALTPYSETNLWCLVSMHSQQGDQGLLLWERFGIAARDALATKDGEA